VSLPEGARLGPYEIIGLIGAGGMGEVYRANDARLGRAVAIKLLPGVFADDPDRLRRFEQEARATAALNHPGVIAVYDIGVHDGAPYIVSELLEGVTLRERLSNGPLPIAACIDYGRQLADGLAAAHERGITHRDLKPENVFVLPGDRLKILDFGLARLTTGAVVSGGGSVAETRQLTMPHTIVGTLGYMAPEQARGELVDHRADIFAFGCVLFEMLEGRRAFSGPTPADTISAILKDPPPEVRSTPERPMPPAVELIVQRCLQKAPEARFQSARDLAFVLNSLTGVDTMRAAAAPPPTSTVGDAPSPRRRPRVLAATLAGLAAAALALFVVARRESAPEASLATEFLVPTPAGAAMGLPGLVPTAPQVGVSPDGRAIAFVASSPDRRRTLWIRSLDRSTPRVIPRTEGVLSWPFWSPDSRFVVVAIGHELRKVEVATGAIERLATLPREAPALPFVTGSWRDEDTILVSIGGPTGLYRVAASGGELQAETKLDAQRGDQYHSWPQLLSDGRFLTFVRTNDVPTTGVYAGRFGDASLTLILPSASRAIYTAGRLLWMSNDRLLAQSVDASSLRPVGQPVTIAPSVFQGAGRTPAFWASENGTLVYSIGGAPGRQFWWVERDGRRIGNAGPPGLYASFDLSPDGANVVAEIAAPGEPARSTLSTLDTTRGVLTPLTTGERNDSDPRFGPNGDIVFTRNSGEAPGIYRANPAGGELLLLFASGSLPAIWMESWGRDGKTLLFRSGADNDVWRVTPTSPRPERLTNSSEPVDQVQLSPDGNGSRTTPQNRAATRSTLRRRLPTDVAGSSPTRAACRRRGAATAARCTTSVSTDSSTRSRCVPMAIDLR
jgi:serine/threonine protein kinase/Tol biopolymer transport system component